MRRAVGGLVLLLLVFSAACGGGSDDKAEPKSKPTPTTTNGPSVSQVASAVAESQDGVLKAIGAIRDCQIGTCESFVKDLSALTLSYAAEGLTARLQTVETKGRIPAEVEELFDRTLTASQETAKEARGYHDCVVADPDLSSCGLAFTIREMLGLEGALEAWGPYL